MHIPSRVACGLAAAAVVAAAAQPTGARAARRRPGGFELTVDSIMRGPKLVGYPPTGLRWSGDSSRLYFEWRRPGDDEAVHLGRAARRRRAAQAVRRRAPQRAAGRRRAGTRRIAACCSSIRATSCCSIRSAGTRRNDHADDRQRSRTRDGRAAKSAVTLHRATTTCSSCRSTAARSSQLTDVQPKKRDPRETDSQKFVKDEEQKLIEHTRVAGGKEEEGRRQGQGARAAEVRARRSPDGRPISSSRPTARTCSSSIVERTETAKRTNVPNYVTESSYTEDIPARTFVGDAQDKRTLAIMNLETGKTSQADAGFAGTVPLKPAQDGKTQPRDGPLGHAADVRRRRAGGRARARRRQQGSLAGRRRSRVGQEPRARHAARRRLGARGRRASDRTTRRSAGCRIRSTSGSSRSATAGCICYSVDATAEQPPAAAADRREVGDRVGRVCRPTRRSSTSPAPRSHPGERHIYAMPIDGGARTKLTSMTGGQRRRSLARRQHVRDRSIRPAPGRTRST